MNTVPTKKIFIKIFNEQRKFIQIVKLVNKNYNAIKLLTNKQCNMKCGAPARSGSMYCACHLVFRARKVHNLNIFSFRVYHCIF
jgi:hypothetical protein